MLIWILIIIGSILLDQVSKLIVLGFLDRNEPFVLIDGVFRFTYVENDGMAFGLLGEHRWVFMVLSTLGIAFMIVYLWKFKPQSKLACVALSLIIGGGIGNMIDRVRLGYVIDFIDFYAFDFWVWVFNIADSCVCIGAGLLILYLIIDIIKDYKNRFAEKALAQNREKAESDEDSQNG